MFTTPSSVHLRLKSPLPLFLTAIFPGWKNIFKSLVSQKRKPPLTRHLTPASTVSQFVYKVIIIRDIQRGGGPKIGPGTAPEPPPSFYVSRKRAFFRNRVILVRMMIVTSPHRTAAAEAAGAPSAARRAPSARRRGQGGVAIPGAAAAWQSATQPTASRRHAFERLDDGEICEPASWEIRCRRRGFRRRPSSSRFSIPVSALVRRLVRRNLGEGGFAISAFPISSPPLRSLRELRLNSVVGENCPENPRRKWLISRLFLSIPVYSCLPPEKEKALNAMQMQCKCNTNAMRGRSRPVKLSPAESDRR